MKVILTFLILSGCWFSSFSQTRYREEFNGPFKSWANVKTRFNASGDGKKDDTKALQAALDSLTTSQRVLFNTDSRSKYLVVYLPAGTYSISQTLRLTGKMGVSFIGEDPEKTIIRWDGQDNDTMLFANRSAYVKMSRITWNANNKKNIEAVGFHYKDFNEPNFAPTTIELSDMIFTGNPIYGISAGTYTSDGTGMMDAEFTIKRCKFYSCTGAGIQIKGFNALDYWIWDCEFSTCTIGVDCSHGNYHVYRSVFNNSAIADLKNKDVNYASVRGCYSNNAAAFSLDEGASCNPFKRIFQGNFVNNCKAIPIQYHHQGKITLLNNYFVKDNTTQQFTVDYSSWCSGNYDILSVDNNYAETNPHNLRKDFPSKVHSIADKKFDRKTMRKPGIKVVQPFLPLVKREIFEVPAGSGSATIQGIINKAAQLKGQRAIVHFPAGNYSIDKTLDIPPGSDMQLLGDGMIDASILTQNGSNVAGFYFIKVNGPSYITIKDLQIGQGNKTDKINGILFSGIDQQKSEVRLDQVHTSTNATLLIDRLDYTYFEKNNSFFSNGNIVIGGDKVKSSSGTSRLYCFGGQSAGVRLENNATMVAKDCWFEGSFRKDFIPVDLNGGYGNLTVDGAMYASSDLDSGALVNVSNFKGKISLLNMYLIGSIYVSPNSPGLKMLIWNINNFHKKNPLLFLKQKMSSKIAMMGITSQCFKSKDISCLIEDPQSLSDVVINVNNVNTFISEMTSDNRKAMPKPFINLESGVSNIYISRVSTYNGGTAYTFRQ